MLIRYFRGHFDISVTAYEVSDRLNKMRIVFTVIAAYAILHILIITPYPVIAPQRVKDLRYPHIGIILQGHVVHVSVSRGIDCLLGGEADVG